MEVPRESWSGEGSGRRAEARGVRKLRDGAGEPQSLLPGAQWRPARWPRAVEAIPLSAPSFGGGAGLLPGRCRSRGEFTEISGPCLRSRPDQWRRKPGGDVGTCGSGELTPPLPRAELSLRSLTEDGAKARAVRREVSGQTIWNEGKCSGCLCPQTPRSTAGKENGHGPPLRFQVPKCPGPSITFNPLNHPLGF